MNKLWSDWVGKQVVEAVQKTEGCSGEASGTIISLCHSEMQVRLLAAIADSLEKITRAGITTKSQWDD